MKISVVINTLNAEKHLDKVLKSLEGFDEIIICDMYSDDNTVAIAKQYNSKIIYHDKTGFVEPARNFAISQAKNPWVLLLDADEAINANLTSYLIKTATENPQIGCIAIPRKNYFMGRFMRSAYPDYVYRFFRKENISWPEHIHSIPIINGHIHKINSDHKELAIEHLANDTISDIQNKNNTYSTAEIPKRQHKKINSFKLVFSPFLWFFKYYFLKKGFLDGKEGFIFAVLKSQYKFLTLSKIIEYKKST